MLADPVTQPQFYQDVAMKRFGAWVVDLLVVLVFTAVAVIFTVGIGLFFLPAIFALFDFIYRVITLANGSSTWGMRLFAVELRDVAGQRFDLGQAFLHTVGYYVSWAVAPLQLISVVLMATSARGQGLSDMVLGSAMLNRRAR